jgi:hypothetical protein
LQYPIGKMLWQGTNWISDVRVSADGKKVAYFRHPPNVDDRGDVMVLSGDCPTNCDRWPLGCSSKRSRKPLWNRRHSIG